MKKSRILLSELAPREAHIEDDATTIHESLIGEPGVHCLDKIPCFFRCTADNPDDTWSGGVCPAATDKSVVSMSAARVRPLPDAGFMSEPPVRRRALFALGPPSPTKPPAIRCDAANLELLRTTINASSRGFDARS